MKKIFLDELPHGGKGISKNRVNWKESIGYEVNFVFNDIKGKLKIIDYYKINNNDFLKIKYNKKEHEIRRNDFSKYKIATILGIYNYEYKYQVGDIITDVKSGKLKILEQIRMGKRNNRGYKYQCLICNNESVIFESNLLKKYGCNVCCKTPRKVVKGINDIATTNPYLASLFANKEDTFKYTEGSNIPVDFKCPSCNNIIKNKKIVDVYTEGLSCPKCGDKISYPNKFIFSILKQLLDDNFENEKIFNWGKDYRYDFYFKINNEKYIIEAQGSQHYQNEFSRIKSNKRVRTLEEEKENDKLKKELALENSIKEDNYIVIDCSHSTLEWIKERILESKLNNIFDLSKIDWLECHKFACSSLVKKACSLWNSGIHSTSKIGKIMKLSKNTIQKYLKQATKLNWCNYNPKEVISLNAKSFSKKYGGKQRKKIICLNNKKIFTSLNKGAEYCNLKSGTTISLCCQNKYKSAGKDPITGEKLYWIYYEDYLKTNNKIVNK